MGLATAAAAFGSATLAVLVLLIVSDARPEVRTSFLVLAVAGAGASTWGWCALRRLGGPDATAARMAVGHDGRFREMFYASPVGMALADEQGLFVEVNPAWCRLLGRAPDELVGRPWSEFTHRDDLDQQGAMEGLVDDGADDGGVLRVEKRWVRPDGGVRWGWLSVAPVHGPLGQRWTLAHAQDVTERKRRESTLQQSQATLTATARVARCVQSGEDPRPVLTAEVRWLAQAASVSILESGASGTLTVTQCLGHDLAGAEIRTTAGAAGRIWAGGAAEMIGADGGDDWGFGPLPAPASTATAWWEPLMDGRTIIGVLAVTWARELDGPADPAVAAVKALAAEVGSVLTAARVRMELEALADTDALTGLENRRGWQTRLRELSASTRRSGRPLTLAIVDLDHFKLYNDAYGHHHGDALLRTFAARAQAQLRQADVIARWGGEEFAIALPGCGSTDAGPLLDRLRTVVPDGQTCSIGYATLLPDESGSECLVRADAMLYRAKREGRNRIVGGVDVVARPAD
ncbi:sensor domain-containing diguanylate cyclase [Nakamurella panacisegetis]|uniref:sensor domain-containing diguanylate cyclase n=1 Tax=Nakamurella panacisegetis TaxID=1090615 RepID=UPI001560770D|nr:sensor domain-containing diguanylate cyclase [Nakamurella panacisegetis]